MSRRSVPSIRTCIDSDLEDIFYIEHNSFDDPWSSADFDAIRHKRNYCAKVAVLHSMVVGYCVFEFDEESLQIHNLAVDPDNRRAGIASSLINWLKDNLRNRNRRWIHAAVSEHNLETHLFLRSQGFEALHVLRWKKDHDAYVFAFDNKATSPRLIRNRVASYMTGEIPQ